MGCRFSTPINFALKSAQKHTGSDMCRKVETDVEEICRKLQEILWKPTSSGMRKFS
jgi:hypothetical protein